MSSYQPIDLREAFRGLLLPIRSEREDDAITAVRDILTEMGIEHADHGLWIKVETDLWREAGSSSPDLQSVIQTGIIHGDPDYGHQVANAYFRLHRMLQADFAFSHGESSGLLGYAGVALRFVHEERMSASQVTAMLSAGRPNARFLTWKPIHQILVGLGARPIIEMSSMLDLAERDSRTESTIFVDADFTVSIDIVTGAADALGITVDLRHLLNTLHTPGAGFDYGPYLQMLYFQAALVEFYDHPPTMLYEFAPRGKSAEALFQGPLQPLAATGNPFLNNAKGQNRLDLGWAEGRKDKYLVPAEAMVRITMALEEMAYLPRREIASWIRQWILRLIRIESIPNANIRSPVPQHHVANLLKHFSSRETQTLGVIEQRMVDALANLVHRATEGWKSRGMGDAVNATNISRKKLGDCDFQHHDLRTVIAFEAHAGRLTEVYLRDHQRTLRRNLKLRLDELENIAPISEWTIGVTFVAHDFAVSEPIDQEIDGFTVQIGFVTFEDLVTKVLDTTSIDEIGRELDRSVLPLLNSNRTPDFVRTRFLELIAD